MEEYIELAEKQNKIAEASRYRRHTGRCRDRRRVLTLQWFALLLFPTLALYFLTLVEVFWMTKDQVKDMFSMRLEGFTLLEIGEKYGISKERVRQLLSDAAGGRNRVIRKNYVFPNIENWMYEKDIMQDEIAKECGCSQNNVSSILIGKYKPSFDFISAVLRMSGMTFEEAFQRREDNGVS